MARRAEGRIVSGHLEELSVDGWIASTAAAADEAERDAASIDVLMALDHSPGHTIAHGRRVEPAPPDQDPTR